MRLQTLTYLLLLYGILMACSSKPKSVEELPSFDADNALIEYTGRIDFSNPKKPRYWAAGVQVKAKFKGSYCDIEVHDQVHGGMHNYIVVQVDELDPVKIKLKDSVNVINVAKDLPDGEHTVTIIKNTESIIGYIEFVGLRAEKLLPLPEKSTRKIEFIGNSITSGMGVDMDPLPCGQGDWYEQHSAYYAYGPRTARALQAQYHLTSESGIGLMHSCCDKPFVLPQVYDKISINQNEVPYDFSYIPDVVTVCLGQNDGIQDSVAFTSAYVGFVNTLRKYYPNAQIVCLSSPMANETLSPVLKNYITGVVNYMEVSGDQKVDKFFFSKSFTGGCGEHPDKADNEIMASELTAFLREKMNW